MKAALLCLGGGPGVHVASPARRPPTKVRPSRPGIGAKARNFDLPGWTKALHPRELRSAKVLVFVFTANHCPTPRPTRSGSRAARGLRGPGRSARLVSPNDRWPSASTSRATRTRRHARGHEDPGEGPGWTFPYLYDARTEAMSRKYGPGATPHVFVFDAEREAALRGPRGRRPRNPAKVTTSDARNAIEAVLGRQDRAGRDDQGVRLLGQVCRTSGRGSRTVREVGAGAVSLDPIDEAGVKAQAKNEGGKKLRLLNVWATWCGPCVHRVPDLVSLHRSTGGASSSW